LGVVDVDHLAFQSDLHASAAASSALDLSPALAPPRRTPLLAQLAQAKERSEHGADMPLPAAVRLGRELGRFLDDLAIDRVSADAVSQIDAGDYAVHWHRVVTFLEIVIQQWPKMLAELDRMDPTKRREALIDAQAEAWTRSPPLHPTIIAGSTGAQLGNRTLMRALLASPNGIIVLPGFENDTDDDGFRHSRESPGHPQHAMATARAAVDVKPREGANLANRYAACAPRQAGR